MDTKENFESFDRGDIVRPYLKGGELKLYKIWKWVSNDVIILVDVRNLDKVRLDNWSDEEISIVIDIDMLHEHYTKKGVPEQAKILYGDSSEA